MVRPHRLGIFLVLAICSFGCSGLGQGAFVKMAGNPGAVTNSSKIHAYSAASVGYGLLASNLSSWDLRLDCLDDDLPTFFDALDRSGFRFDLRIVPHQAENQGYEYHDIHLVLISKSGERYEVPGSPGTRTADYIAALRAASKASSIEPEVLRRGHFALYALDSSLATMSVTDDTLRRYAFGLLVLKDKLARGETRTDYLAPNRPAADSIEDIDLALRVVADYFAQTEVLRAEGLTLIALAREYEIPQSRQALTEQVADSRKRSRDWLASHQQPRLSEYGVEVQRFKLPTADSMMQVLDKDGYLAASIKIARGVLSGDLASTIEGIGKLAPENSSMRKASEGAASAFRGDLVGVVSSVEALTTREQSGKMVQRLRSIDQFRQGKTN